jgi:hypothetical protein
MQQLRRNAQVQGPAATDAAYRSLWLTRSAAQASPAPGTPQPFRPTPIRPRPRLQLTADWNVPLGAGTGLAAGHYPAKYSVVPITVASCNDFVVFPTGASSSATQATIVAFKNLYVGGCPGAPSTPSVFWAYNTGAGATASLSPVLSIDGSQVAFIQTISGTASLVILKMADSGGTATLPIAPTLTTPAGYRACAAPCFTTLSLGAANSNSAPFYLYDSTDTLYVGDNIGRLHRFAGVFRGTPAVVIGWPVTVTVGGVTAGVLNSPVYDFGTGSTPIPRVFLSDTKPAGAAPQCPAEQPGRPCGRVYSVTVGATPSFSASSALDCGTGFKDPPIVDSTRQSVYAFIGSGCDIPNQVGNSYINRFITDAVSGTGANFVSFVNGQNGANLNTLNTTGRVGTFDNLYFSGSTQGKMYACVNGRIYRILAATNGNLSALSVFSTPVNDVADDSTSACSPVTEFLGNKAGTAPTTLTAPIGATGQTLSVASTTNWAQNDYIQIDSEIMQIISVTPTTLTVNRPQLGTTAAAHSTNAVVQNIADRIFVSVAANGNAAGCFGACVYSYNVTTGTATGTPSNGLTATGGTSGIVIDSKSATPVGGQQIYYTRRGDGHAVQASQSALE